jgi:hypothetical protein
MKSKLPSPLSSSFLLLLLLLLLLSPSFSVAEEDCEVCGLEAELTETKDKLSGRRLL